MADKKKKKINNQAATKPAKSDLKPFQAEKEEKIDLKSIANDERTWKIVGATFILLSFFLFISFVSYLFTWRQDQVIILPEDGPKNLLGNFGAVVSSFFFVKGFGVASFLICTFFFVVGVNLLFRDEKLFFENS